MPRELIPLVPGSFAIEQAKDYTLTYRVTDLGGHTTVLPREDVFHLRGPSWAGTAGLDALQVAREAVGLAIATEQTHAALHANGTQPGGVLSVKGSPDDAARVRLKEAWAQYQGGLQNRSPPWHPRSPRAGCRWVQPFLSRNDPWHCHGILHRG